jgi:hypothetical protein
MVQLLAPPSLTRAGSVFHPTPAVGVRLHFAVYAFQFCWGCSICPGAVLDYVPGDWVGESCVVPVAHLLGLQVYVAALKPAAGRNGMLLFSRQTLSGPGSGLALGCREAFHRLGVQDITEFDSG